MEEEKISRKVRYTRNIIRETFQEMLQEMPLRKITVKALCERADINRATFYTHYANCEDLLKHCEAEAAQKALAAMQNAEKNAGTFASNPLLTFEALAADHEILRWLYSPWCTGHGERLLYAQMEKQYCTDWTQYGLTQEEIGRFLAYAHAASAAFLRSWLLSGFAGDPVSVGKQYQEIVTCTMRYVFDRPENHA